MTVRSVAVAMKRGAWKPASDSSLVNSRLQHAAAQGRVRCQHRHQQFAPVAAHVEHVLSASEIGRARHAGATRRVSSTLEW